MGEVTFSIPDHISQEDAQSVISAFMAAQQTSSAAPVEEQQQPTADTVTVGGGEVVSEHGPIVIVYDKPGTDDESPPVPYEDDEQNEQPDEQNEQPDERSYSSVPSTMGSIPLVSMTMGAVEGGILGSLAAAREAEEASALAALLTEYGNAAREAADDPDRKRPPRAEPSLVDSAVRSVIDLMHERTRRFIMGVGDNGGEPEKFGGEGSSLTPIERVRTSNVEQGYIAFTIRRARRWEPYTKVNNNGSTGWGIIPLILKEYGVEFTPAQVRASLGRLVDSGFIMTLGMCGKQTRYTLCDHSGYIIDENDYIA